MATVFDVMYTTDERKEINDLIYRSDPDLDAPALDMVGALGREMTFSNTEVNWSEYTIEAGSQPDEAEGGTPNPQFNTKTRYSNVAQIFARSTELTFSQLGNQMLSISGSATEVGQFASGQLLPTDEFQHQLDICMKQIRRDMDYTLLRGVYVRPTDASADNRRTRGIISFVQTFAAANFLDNGATGPRALTKALVEEAELARRAGGGGPGVIVAHPVQVTALNDLFKTLSDDTASWIPRDRFAGGRNLRYVITPWGDPLPILPNRNMPNDQILIADFSAISSWIHPVPGLGGLFVWQIPRGTRTAAAEVYCEMGFKYESPFFHAVIADLLTS